MKQTNFFFCLLEKLATLAAQMAATLQCTYLPITAHTVLNAFFITTSGRKWICVLWLGYHSVVSNNDHK